MLAKLALFGENMGLGWGLAPVWGGLQQCLNGKDSLGKGKETGIIDARLSTKLSCIVCVCVGGGCGRDRTYCLTVHDSLDRKRRMEDSLTREAMKRKRVLVKNKKKCEKKNARLLGRLLCGWRLRTSHTVVGQD